jgi:hypothetical protein
MRVEKKYTEELLDLYCSTNRSDRMKKDEMDEACGTFVEEEMWIWILVEGI